MNAWHQNQIIHEHTCHRLVNHLSPRLQPFGPHMLSPLGLGQELVASVLLRGVAGGDVGALFVLSLVGVHESSGAGLVQAMHRLSTMGSSSLCGLAVCTGSKLSQLGNLWYHALSVHTPDTPSFGSKHHL